MDIYTYVQINKTVNFENIHAIMCLLYMCAFSLIHIVLFLITVLFL